MKTQIDKLDALFSEFIRKRAIQRVHGCERCGAYKTDYKQLQCAHLISRWHKSVRWDEDVALGLCGGCHMWIDHEAEEKTALLKRVLGQERFDLLQSRARIMYPKPDKKMLMIYYEQEIAKL